jgi:hypothetical protein
VGVGGCHKFRAAPVRSWMSDDPEGYKQFARLLIVPKKGAL